MKALDRKLLRDLRLMWSQAGTIALVVASGIAGFITTLSAVESMALARDRFYAEAHFADVFAAVKRAPQSLEPTLRELPGVAEVQTTTEFIVRVTVPGSTDPVLGQLIGVDLRQGLRLNQVRVRHGAPLSALGERRGDGVLPVLVSEGFADGRGLKPGDEVQALMNGKQRRLRIVGTALSPEYVFAGLFGMPDLKGFGVFWLDREALSAAYDMDGAFNRVALKLAPDGDEGVAIAELAARLGRYGGREAHGRKSQISNAMLDDEIKSQHVIGTVLPSIFLGVAAFLLNVVVSRLVATQREQIAALKALGYPNRDIALHYLKMVLAIVAVGLVLGVALGDWLGGLFTGLYAEFYRFPVFEHHIAPDLLVISLGLTLATAVVGTLNAIGATVRLTPAEAMRPPAPGQYRRTLFERLGLTRMSPAMRMILRNMERRPLRTTLSVAGVAAAVAIVILGNFFRDAIGKIVDTQFTLAMRSDISVWMTDPVPASAGQGLARLDGVLQVEPARYVPVTLIHEHRRERNQIRGYPPDPQLWRVIDVKDRAHAIPEDGLLMTDRLATKLGLRLGDTVQVEVLEGRPRTVELPVTALVSDTMGLNVYMERRALNRILGEDDVATGFSLAIARGADDRVLEATRGMPKVSGAFSKATMLHNMEAITARNVRIMSSILTVFASVIAIGVVYNNARIALAERTWELASLRVLGLTRAEVSTLLLGEMALSIAVAVPLGMLLGWGLVHAIVEALKNDQFFFPVAILPRTYAWSGLCVAAAGVVSALVVRRHIDRLDMVAALKTRE